MLQLNREIIKLTKTMQKLSKNSRSDQSGGRGGQGAGSRTISPWIRHCWSWLVRLVILMMGLVVITSGSLHVMERLSGRQQQFCVRYWKLFLFTTLWLRVQHQRPTFLWCRLQEYHRQPSWLPLGTTVCIDDRHTRSSLVSVCIYWCHNFVWCRYMNTHMW